MIFIFNREFVFPDEEIIQQSKATTNSYTHPILKIVFWERYKKAFSYLQRELRDSKKEKFDNLLEIGSSYGLFLPALCQLSTKVVGSDVESTFHFCQDKTLKQIQEQHPNLELKIADVKQLEKTFPNDSMDVILAFSVLEHVDKVDKAVKNIYNCLKPKGLFICELPLENRFYKLGRFMAGYKETHEGYDPKQWENIIKTDLKEESKFQVPYGLPLFQIGVYRKI